MTNLRKALLLAASLAMTATTLLASSDLSLMVLTPIVPIRAGYSSQIQLGVLNPPRAETARNVVINVTANVPITCNCSLGMLQAGVAGSGFISFTAPSTAGTITFSATVSSDTPDPDLSNNTVSATIPVSTDPDLYINASGPQTQDLAVPFQLFFFLENFSMSDAHDVVVTINFRDDVGIQSLPEGCSSPVAGRIVCSIGTVPAQAHAMNYSATLVAPQTYGSGSIVFTASVTERETDFDPITNTKTSTTKLYDPFRVTTTANDGSGSLRQAILDANVTCVDPMLCKIFFAIGESSATAWKTIRVASPLPAITASNLIFDGATQTKFSGDTNPDGPEIEISGGGIVDGDGLFLAACHAEVANLAIGGFRGNGISVIAAPPAACTGFYQTLLHNLFLGTDPTGSSARANGRGIGVSPGVGDIVISGNVISGNLRSGIFGLGGHLLVSTNRIGVKAHADEPLPNGASGILVGDGCYGSDIGEQGFVTLGGAPGNGANVIAFNGETGVAVSSSVINVAIRNNRIWGNALLGIDIGLDGPGSGASGTKPILAPTLTLAHYDPVSNKTIIEGDLNQPVTTFPSSAINFYANDTGDPSGYGEGQRPIGSVQATAPPHFHFEAPGNLTGQFISATTTRLDYEGFAKPAGYEQGLLSQTSEFSRWIEVR